MKTILSTAVVLACTLGASAAIPELSGIYIEGDKALFVLMDPGTGNSSRWLALGQDFEGYALKEFQSAADTVILAKAGAKYAVKLRAAKVKYAATALTGTIELGAGRSTRLQRATLVFGEESIFPVAGDLILAVRPELLNDGNIAYHSRFEKTGADGRKQVLDSPAVVAPPGVAFSLHIGDLGFSLKP